MVVGGESGLAAGAHHYHQAFPTAVRRHTARRGHTADPDAHAARFLACTETFVLCPSTAGILRTRTQTHMQACSGTRSCNQNPNILLQDTFATPSRAQHADVCSAVVLWRKSLSPWGVGCEGAHSARCVNQWRTKQQQKNGVSNAIIPHTWQLRSPGTCVCVSWNRTNMQHARLLSRVLYCIPRAVARALTC